MARATHYRQAVHTLAQLRRGISRGRGGLRASYHHPADSVAPHSRVRHHEFQLALSGLSHHRHLSHITLRAIYRERQHIARHHTYSLCHRPQAKPAEEAQLLELGHCFGHHHRIRWQCRSRGSHRAHRVCHRKQSGQTLQHGQPKADAPGGMWRLGGYLRHLQGTHSRTRLHHRSSDDRPHHGFAYAHSRRVSDSCPLQLRFQRQCFAVPFLTRV